MKLFVCVAAALPALAMCAPAPAQSAFRARLDDPKAVYVSAPAGADADATQLLQAAIDKAEGGVKEGIVFVAPGTYRITRTVYVWPGVRIIGYGETRPLFVLPANTPGFGKGVADMVMFTGARRGGVQQNGGERVPVSPQGMVPFDPAITDANSGTFYSVLSNINFRIEVGNPAAIAIRFHVAQHAYLSHMRFDVGDGLAALTQVGNEAEDLQIHGGRYGILTEKTSPAWQFTLIDSTFDGQREAAIREHEAGLTLIRDTIRNVPKAIDIDPHYYDQLWVKDSRFENITGPVVTISDERTALNEIGFENDVMVNAPLFARFRESGKTVQGKGPVYRVANFTQGLMVPSEGEMGTVGMRFEASPLASAPAPLPRAIEPLPPVSDWVNVHTIGVKGDGATDDTVAIRQAIAAHRVLYFPGGHYIVRDTLRLKPDTVMIGLHPTLTQFDLPDGTPGFQGVGTPRAVIEAPAGGTNILSGFGIMTSGINPRATGVLWHAGEQSLIDDVRFLGGHGSGTNPYNNNHTADPDLRRKWDSQYPSLWVEGGGGTFADIWTPDTFAQAGFYVSNTTTPGHVYELSNEHHVRNEIRLNHVANWDINAPQTEEEAGESPESLSLEIDDSRNVTIANYHAYRVTRSRAPYPTAVRVFDSSDIHFRNVHVNGESGYAHCDEDGCGTFLRVTKYPYENSVTDMTHHLETREREFASLDISAQPSLPKQADESAVLAPGEKVRKLEDGFFSIAGAAVDGTGKLYFVDRHQQRIYGWSAQQGLTVERDNALDPVNLAVTNSGDLLVLSAAGQRSTVYVFHPGSPETELTVLQPQNLQTSQAQQFALAANYWNNGEFRDQLDPATMTFTTLGQMFAADVTTPKKEVYVSPGGSVVLPAGRVWQQGPAGADGWRFSDNLDTYGFLQAKPGQLVYVSNESEDVTYSAHVQKDGTLADLKPFVYRGGESVAVDRSGNVYVANGQVFVYRPDGTQIARIDVPERPLQLVFGGKYGRTLFILTHHALFAAQVL